MENKISEAELESMRQQFEAAPYPKVPLEESPRPYYYVLFQNSLVTPYYLRHQKVIDPAGKMILDVGCGSGYTSLVLAEANPGAQIYGVDLSEKSVELARKRLEYHGFQEAQFQPLSIYDLPDLNLKFDYINCSDVLYLIPDQLQGLQAMKAVLKPDGIIRVNVHSYANRFYMFQMQRMFEFMGLMNGPIGKEEIDIAQSVMDAVKDNIILKSMTWRVQDGAEERMRANGLLQGDKGFTIREVFSLLNASDLEFISMVEWHKWNLMDLFKEPDNLPPFLAMSLPECSIEDQLYLFELLEPKFRLIDFWCGHTGESSTIGPVAEWTDDDWRQAQIHLHPQFKTHKFKEGLTNCVNFQQMVELGQYLPGRFEMPIFLESSITSCLLLLWEGGQSMEALVKYWLTIRPVDPITLSPIQEEVAFSQLRQFLKNLADISCILPERVG
ncbi:SAM-dependent methyltransferase [Leptolyngbya sp. 'hensonii']|uniref:class I SAM-dependent methyltransferase n=1 Tax=Leptolyngbya sp. 'hensonii' TaxID=1922337 RepID=UPI0009503255|nr:class I SAM-dependent methyltransferase [Leptolyngbya sp. 'hensonii']OLP15524.1 SAM-dependent methyltransferase [Leptolyngbya sp. 'hensonii']